MPKHFIMFFITRNTLRHAHNFLILLCLQTILIVSNENANKLKFKHSKNYQHLLGWLLSNLWWIFQRKNTKLTLLDPACEISGWSRGGEFQPLYGKKNTMEKPQILFYTVNYTYIMSSDPKGFVFSFKTLDFVALKNSAGNCTYASKNSKICSQLLWCAAKN